MREISDLVIDFQVWEEKRVWRHSKKKAKLAAMQPMPDDECDEKQKSLLPHLQWPWLAFIIIKKKNLISREEEEERAAEAASIESMFSFVQRRFWVDDSHEKKMAPLDYLLSGATWRHAMDWKRWFRKKEIFEMFLRLFCFWCESEWQAELFFEHLSSWDGQETSKWKFVLRARSKKKFPIKKKRKWQLLVHFHST